MMNTHMRQIIFQVDNQEWNLPVNLDNGKVTLTQSGLSVVVGTDFGLVVQYNWQQYLAITVPTEFAGKMCGLCGNFNGKPEDDLTTPSGVIVKDPQDMGTSWKVPGVVGEANCLDMCPDQCQDCKLEYVQQLEYEIICRALAEVMDTEFGACDALFHPKDYLYNCMFELCHGVPMKKYYCDTLQLYSDTCQRAGFPGQDWRDANKCRKYTIFITHNETNPVKKSMEYL